MGRIEHSLISDAHIADDTPAMYEALDTVLHESDYVHAVGDMFELHAFPGDSLYKTRYAKLFPLMQKRGFVYVGNHDTQQDYKDIKPFWLKMVYMNTFINGGQEFMVTHGHMFDSAAYIDRLLRIGVVRKIMPLIKTVEQALLHKFQSKGFEEYYHSWNDEQKDGFDLIKSSRLQWGIAGHTHIAERDVERRYMNLGQFPHSWGEITRGVPTLRFG
jgi:predicted phosphodiesterase